MEFLCLRQRTHYLGRALDITRRTGMAVEVTLFLSRFGRRARKLAKGARERIFRPGAVVGTQLHRRLQPAMPLNIGFTLGEQCLQIPGGKVASTSRTSAIPR